MTMELRTPQCAHDAAHHDAAREYRKFGSVARPGFYLEGYEINPFGGYTSLEITEAYLWSFRMTWNALVDIDRAMLVAISQAKHPTEGMRLLRTDANTTPKIAPE